jgi:hypothetical protein
VTRADGGAAAQNRSKAHLASSHRAGNEHYDVEEFHDDYDDDDDDDNDDDNNNDGDDAGAAHCYIGDGRGDGDDDVIDGQASTFPRRDDLDREK